MSKPVYRYNPETCRYERVGISTSQVVGFFFNVVFTGAFLFGVTILIQNSFFPTEAEHALRTENKAIVQSQKQLKLAMGDAEGVLTLLDDQDASIHKTLFPDTPINSEVSEDIPDSLLLVNARQFTKTTAVLSDRIKHIEKISHFDDRYFANKLKLTDEQEAFLATIPSIEPIPDNTDQAMLISGFGMRINPFHKGNYEHPGVDFAAPRGTEVQATADGTVINTVHTNLQAGYGNYIDVSHHNGFVTRYAHLESITVRDGQRVKKGDKIGTVGSSGGSVAPHVHYEIFRDGKQVNPAMYMIEGMNSDDYHKMMKLASRPNQSLD